jgi:hydroxyacylglutathione hydrolase
VNGVTSIALDGANCYLIATHDGFALIDTGYPHMRTRLVQALDDTGCRPDNLKLIVLTHGDIDHSGNAAYLRARTGARIAMHPGDAAMCLNDGVSRKRDMRLPEHFPPVLYLWFVEVAAKTVVLLLRRTAFEPFSPDVLIEDQQDLGPLGLDAVAYHTPGHSKGSISLLTPDGALFCGDHLGQVWGHVLENRDDPAFPSTHEKLRSLPIKVVCPGHGAAFAAERVRSRVGMDRGPEGDRT